MLCVSGLTIKSPKLVINASRGCCFDLKSCKLVNIMLAYFRMFLIIAAFQSAACAGIIVTVQNSTLSQGGTGWIDVYLSGAPLDTLGRFSYEFNITGAIPQAGDLQFSASQVKTEQDESGPPPYFFYGDTDPGSLSSALGGDAVTLLGDDTLATLDSVSVDGQFLLARLELEHIGLMSVGSHDFTVSLNVLSPFTEFDRDYDFLTDNSYLSTEFSAISGTVTVQSAAAVPEPSSILVWSIGALYAVVVRTRRWAKKCPPAIPPE
jgi:hypothetical protein